MVEQCGVSVRSWGRTSLVDVPCGPYPAGVRTVTCEAVNLCGFLSTRAQGGPKPPSPGGKGSVETARPSARARDHGVAFWRTPHLVTCCRCPGPLRITHVQLGPRSRAGGVLSCLCGRGTEYANTWPRFGFVCAVWTEQLSKYGRLRFCLLA